MSASASPPPSSASKPTAPPPTEAQLDAFKAQADLSLSLLRQQLGKYVTGYKPRTKEDDEREDEALKQAKPTPTQLLARKLGSSSRNVPSTNTKNSKFNPTASLAGPSSLKRQAADRSSGGVGGDEDDDDDSDDNEGRGRAVGKKGGEKGNKRLKAFEGKKKRAKKAKLEQQSEANVKVERNDGSHQGGNEGVKEEKHTTTSSGNNPFSQPTLPLPTSSNPSSAPPSTATLSATSSVTLQPSSSTSSSSTAAAPLPPPTPPAVAEPDLGLGSFNLFSRPKPKTPSTTPNIAPLAKPILNLTPLGESSSGGAEMAGGGGGEKKKKKNRKARKHKGSIAVGGGCGGDAGQQEQGGGQQVSEGGGGGAQGGLLF